MRSLYDTLPCLRPHRRLTPTPYDGDIRLDLDGVTDRGCRRARNEDQFLIAELQRWMGVHKTSLSGNKRSVTHGQGTLMLVADGMGGHGAGDLASAVVTDAIAQHVMYRMPWFGSDGDHSSQLLDAFSTALARCHQRLEAVAARKGIAHQRPGTTLTLAYVSGRTLYVLHAGDSRCYLFREGGLTRLTRDHTVAQQLRDASADATPRSQLEHILLNAVGAGSAAPHADVLEVGLRVGDVILLCSDGLTAHVDDEALAGHLGRARSASRCCRELVDTAKSAGGSDNVTAVVCRVRLPRSPARLTPPAGLEV